MSTNIDALEMPGEVDLFSAPNLIGGVDYVVTVLGVSNAGGTLADPAVAILDSAGNAIAFNDDSFALGDDPMLTFKAPVSGNYTIAVGDLTGGIGTYTLVFDQAGVPSPIDTPPSGAIF